MDQNIEELEAQVRALGFDIEPTEYGCNIMTDFDTMEVSSDSYKETLHDLVQQYTECECGATMKWLISFFGQDYRESHISDCPDCGQHTLHVSDESQRCTNCKHSSGVDAEGNVYRNGQIVSNGGKSIDQLRGEYFDGYSFLVG